MLISVKILLISTLFSSLLFGITGVKGVEITTTKNIAEIFKKTENVTKRWNFAENPYSFNNSKEIFNPKLNNTSFGDTSNKIQGTTDIFRNSSTDYSGTLTSTAMVSTSSSPASSFVSRELPQNSSENFLPVSTTPTTTPTVFSENVTSFTSDTMKTPENSSISIGITPVPNTTSETPMTRTPEEWLTTTNENIPYQETTPYQDKTTPRQTTTFTNNSKIFSNTSDSQKVLRLDNAPEPYDMSFGNSNYYNSSMNDPYISAGQENARDSIPMDDIPRLSNSV
ncbi:mucin-15 isoform X2 [Suncus etruscus]|uniref:mucin-15 isoform X2 n=1 Tax=Suncus etruscus TaxID=109475 RepID=UPI00211036F0|nr:mucin-15 isoform X2 [Suncus etruscus]